MKEISIYSARGYQRSIPSASPSSCRYYSTHSSYMIKVIQTHGALGGTIMGTAQVSRYHPFAKGGIDYVLSTFQLT